MKILHINSSGFKEGGAEAIIVLTRSVLEKRGHEVRILASDARPDLPHFNEYSFKTPTGLFSIPRHLFNISAYRSLRRALKEFKPDIVHVNTVGHASPLILFALRDYPTVATIHGPEGYTKALLLWCLPASNFKQEEYIVKDLTHMGRLRYFYSRYVTYPAYRWSVRNIDVFITPSTYLQELMHEEGVESIRVPNGTPLLRHNPLPEAKTAPHTLLYAGRLEKYKGVDYLLYALPDIISKFPDTHLYIAGDGRAKSDLESITTSLNLIDHVTFTGHVKFAELETLYAQSSVVVVPSTWTEAFGLVGIEAMSVGRPVVASDVGGISDWLTDGMTGFLVKPRDSRSISDAIIKLFSDPDMMIQMGEEARKKSEEFDIEKYVDRLEAVYEDLIRTPASYLNSL